MGWLLRTLRVDVSSMGIWWTKNNGSTILIPWAAIHSPIATRKKDAAFKQDYERTYAPLRARAQLKESRRKSARNN